MPITRDLSILLRDEGIKDVWLIGYIETGTRSREFHPMLWWIYVEFHNAFLRLQAVNEWHIRFEIVKSVAVNFGVDPHDEFGTVSVGCLFLPTVPKKSHKVMRFDALI